MLDKHYRPDEVEARLYAEWEKAGAFRIGRRDNAQPYTIVIPPPNVTGSLHMGHALNNTLQDVLIRFERMRGRDTLWQPGTDHAGIATQMVVERQLAAEGRSRQELGREAFVERVWKWKEESGGTITRQLRRLGASCDWSRERFTMDEGLSRAVRKVFVDLHRQGLIYRDKRLVNWDPKLKTSISDLEVEPREVDGQLWHFRYPVEGEEGTFITVATTRPETMLGDSGVAVHPEDARFRHLVGKRAIHPVTGRALPIVADEYADPETGTGAVKMTPAHDFNDFEVGRRHGLELIDIMTPDATINDNAPERYRGLDRFEARRRIVAEMEEKGYLEKVEPHRHAVPHGDRSGVPIEPRLSDQWYVDAKTLAGPAIRAVEEGRTRIVPKQWEKTYFDWMRNIQPWNISRQLWWGHQIPAWYGSDGHIFVELTEEEAREAARRHYGREEPLRRDEDVLDTWFSSALWPFSTLGWPDRTPELARYYPTDVLVTGFDILFFWVARMMMMGLHFMGEVPFHTVYIHALVRDEKGQKMSKSKGNVMDPLDSVESYGADALRFTLAAMAAQGRDVKLSNQRIEGYRNFATKLWNAARFCEMNECRPVAGFDPKEARQTVNRWILGALRETSGLVTEALEAYRFNDAAGAVYHFTWGTFCDWYLEFIKPLLAGQDEAAKAETRAVTAHVLDTIVALLHPFMPFVTEELWQRRAVPSGAPLMLSAWPDIASLPHDEGAMKEMDWVVRLISAVRAVRAEMNIPPASKLDLHVAGAASETLARLAAHEDQILRLARLERIITSGGLPKGSVQVVLDEATLGLPLAGVVDLGKEKARLDKELVKIEGEIRKIEAKLGNPGFVAKAPEEVVEENRERLSEFHAMREKLMAAQARLRSI
ncbi:MAG: valine--tRNA ligase [Alphaproteobacteria bacterium]|nr:valine--tRNA ligase [Alphaproteobacteria bacterium]